MYFILAETTSIQWRPNMKHSDHDVFINEAIKLEKFMDDLLSKTLISFVEAKVIKTRFTIKEPQSDLFPEINGPICTGRI